MSKPNVVHVVLPIKPGGGGPSGYAYQLREALIQFPSHRYNISFQEMTFKHSLPGRIWRKVISRLPQHCLPKKDGLRDALHKATGQFNSGQIDFREISKNDLVIAHHALIAKRLLAQHRRRCPVAIMPHSPVPLFAEIAASHNGCTSLDECATNPLVKRLLRQELDVYSKADFIILPSYHAAAGYRAVGPEWEELFSSSNVVTCLTGIQSPPFIKTRDEWRQKLNISRQTYLATFVGRYHPHKGIDLLLSGANLLRNSGYKNFALACAGGQSNGADAEGVIHIGKTDDIGGLLSASDFVVNPNRNVYFDLICLEALAMGKPLLLTNVGGHKDLKQLIPDIEMMECTPEGVADGLQRMFTRKDLSELGKKMRDEYLRLFAPNVFVENHERLYDKMFDNV